jgi:ribosome-associated protein
MDIKKLQTAVVDALEDVKAQDIKIFDTSHLTSLFDRVAIASGTSNRQTKALAASVRDKVKAKGGNVISVEGAETGEWVLVDLGDMIVHIMQPAIRAYYRLEEIWGDKEVKLGAAKRVASTAAAKREAEEAPAPTKIRRTRAQAEAVEASQALDDEAPKKTRKPRASTAAASEPKPAARAPRTPRAPASATAGKATTGVVKKKAAPAKKAVGKTIKVAAPKSASAPKKAPAKRAPRAKA